MKTLILAGGCFWCTEAIFKYVSGVEYITPGYIGGKTVNPSYEEVCSETTGHAEAVKIIYDENKIDLDKLLTIFFKTHDPTTINRQGNDVGSQYRSAMFYENDIELKTFEDFIEKLNQEKVYGARIVTSLEKKTKFYEAEEFHHNYFEKNPLNGYCNIVVRPKVEKFRNEYKF